MYKNRAINSGSFLSLQKIYLYPQKFSLTKQTGTELAIMNIYVKLLKRGSEW